MIDPLVSAAFSVFSNKGAYALVLGSGISTAAGIPTGWQVVLDLIRKLAVASGEEEPSNPEAWYREKFGNLPGYSQLLNSLGSTQAERLNLLRGYFEPNEQEREQGLKIPTVAHHAIADLVAGGYIRVLITTNFDRLLEAALESRGITPVVISTPDAVEGMLPLQHQNCVLLKVNGDYLDLRFRNTVDELTDCDPRLTSLLDRVFDEYGLIVCGWSTDWDIGLRAAIERARSLRFTCYWAHHGPMGVSARGLVNSRRAVPIPIVDANKFSRQPGECVPDRAWPHSCRICWSVISPATLCKAFRPPALRSVRRNSMLVARCSLKWSKESLASASRYRARYIRASSCSNSGNSSFRNRSTRMR
jgi:hypothetical protein